MTDTNDWPAPTADDDRSVEPDDDARPVRQGPGAMMRFIAVLMGAFMFGTGRAVQQVGGAAAVVIGVLIEVAAGAIVLIAAGAVEWFVRRRRAR